jgi:hypothetical protein
MKSFEAGTLAGAGSFRCEACGFAVALHEGDEVPPCPSCGGDSYRRATMFGETTSDAVPRIDDPDWLAEAREALVAEGDYLAFESDERVQVVALQDGWTRVGRSLSAHLRLDDPTVSRRHALVHRDSRGEVKVLDDRSLNGVFKNGEGVEISPLEDGDTISVGRFNLHFIRLGGEDGDGAQQPAAGAVS